MPHAAAPVGALRWSPPAPAHPWSGVRDGARFGDRCPQSETLGVFARPSTTEACRFVNIFRPSHAGAASRPVMVWIHGGGLFDGASDDYDPARLVTRGDLIVVTFNYRLGVLGFPAHPALDRDAQAGVDYGLMDQQAALRRVRGNIASFGGDPGNVTLFGESAHGCGFWAGRQTPWSR